MEYEFAQELKDAGFPLNEKRKLLGKYDKAYAPNSPDGVLNPDYAIVPTLEELIEACGPQFISLRKVPSGWDVLGRQNKYDDIQSDEMHCGGSTPKESLTRLWLALNKK